jgi:7-carboxy-7-deazaguanine synthase
MRITEIYKSLQGESSWAGLPCVFVRLTGCNLRCSWCDSEYTFSGGAARSVDEVFDEALALFPPGSPQLKLVEITGGEPLLQEKEVVPLMQRLLDAGCTVLLETSGERPLANVPKDVNKIVDVKCPDSGEGGRFHLPNLDVLQPWDEVKFVIASRGDYEFAREFTREHGLASRVAEILYSPAFRKDARGERSSANCLVDPMDLATWILQDELPVRLGLQLHKYVWDPAKKGV